VKFVNNRVSCIVLRGRWCNIIVLNVHAPSEEKKCKSFYEELEKVFDNLLNYPYEISVREF